MVEEKEIPLYKQKLTSRYARLWVPQPETHYETHDGKKYVTHKNKDGEPTGVRRVKE